MPLLYQRKIVVHVAGLEISEPRISFEMEREPDEVVPNGEVTIYNLSRDHENQIHDRGTDVRLDAGYPETIATLYDGQVDRITRERTQLKRITRIELGSFTTWVNRLGGVSSRSYNGAETVRNIARDLVGDMNGLGLGPLDLIPNEIVENFAWAGSAAVGLRSLCKRVGVTWYEDDGVIRFNRPGIAQPDAIRIKLSPDLGLIGAPSITDQGAEAVSALQPLARVGNVVELESQSLQGDWKIVGIRHKGDNWEGVFRTFYRLRPLGV